LQQNLINNAPSIQYTPTIEVLPQNPLLNDPGAKDAIAIFATSSIPVLITQKAVDAGIDPILALVIIKTESQYKTTARSTSSTAKGLAQILDGTWKSYDCTGDPFIAEDNIDCMIAILRTPNGILNWSAATGTRSILRKYGFLKIE
jgi:soluble lytic murein transglycosylase-like protein